MYVVVWRATRAVKSCIGFDNIRICFLVGGKSEFVGDIFEFIAINWNLCEKKLTEEFLDHVM